MWDNPYINGKNGKTKKEVEGFIFSEVEVFPDNYENNGTDIN
jgi:hypothetical protein